MLLTLNAPTVFNLRVCVCVCVHSVHTHTTAALSLSYCELCDECGVFAPRILIGSLYLV